MTTGDRYASIADLIGASVRVEAAIHPAAWPELTGTPACNLAMAATLVGHAHDYYAVSGLPDLAGQAAEVQADLAALAIDPPANGAAIYSAVWGRPLSDPRTLGGLWDRADAAARPWTLSPWLVAFGVGSSIAGAVLGGVIIERLRR